jgi:hypothetical protein
MALAGFPVGFEQKVVDAAVPRVDVKLAVGPSSGVAEAVRGQVDKFLERLSARRQGLQISFDCHVLENRKKLQKYVFSS